MKYTTLFLTLLFIFFCSCSPSSYDVTVIKVTDGDTVLLNDNRQLRYIGIDTPETRVKEGDTWKEIPSPFGKEATDLNKRLVEGKAVRVEFDVQKTDKYGRLLGYVFVNGTFVNRKLLEEGYAVLYTYPPNVKYLEEFKDAQEKAKLLEKGIWGSANEISAAEAEKFMGEIKTVRDEVGDCYCTDKACSLYLGRGENFKVVIFKNSFPYFKKECPNICSCYLHKNIGVTGRIREYRVPEIIVNVPEEIEILN